MPSNWYTPTAVLFALGVVLALVAGFGDWSAAAITGGTAVIAVIWALMIARADGLIGRGTAERHTPH